MFLNLLNREEKVAFLEIAHHIAWSNDDFSDTQKNIIATYCLEMQIEDIQYDRNDEQSFNLSKTLAKVTNPRSQRIMLLESMALVFGEHVSHLDNIHKEEKRVIDEMIQAFALSKSHAIIYAEWTKAMLSLSTQGRALIEL
ncbi:hypothetical protein [Helicobacter sp. MIT 14-3879]|uniref:hypothetical protein n=1 Tax=Helicobacter sp. MIT 14-3879 TaxID=2040649 RepID=UPI000E1F4144|nr:hypothetical protein [Helicobacter sp. MIT 14-3879]RDU59868.1 hypothetical protein CQA44_11100 [Helicobacter sp. MIT 14-3879]